MKKLLFLFLTAVATTVFGMSYAPAAAPDDDGFVDIFDGKTLDGWDGNKAIWSVEDGCITGTTGDSGDNHLTYNQFLIWRDGTADDFVLEFDIKLSKEGNSGMQIRSWEDPDPSKPYRVYGYQPDCDGMAKYSGIIYGENYRGILAERGTESVIGDDHKPVVVKRFAKDEDLKKTFKIEDWNHYQVTAQGYRIEQKVNDVLFSVLTDNDKEVRRRDGIIAIQVHVGPPMKVQLKNIKLKRLPMQDEK